MNVQHFLGNLTRDPELKSLQSGSQVLNFTVAVNNRYKRDGEIVKEAVFIECEAWNKTAEIIHKFFKKGDSIIVHTNAKQEYWDDPATGAKRTKLRFRVNDFEFIPGGRKDRTSESEASAGSQEPEMAAAGAENNIPF